MDFIKYIISLSFCTVLPLHASIGTYVHSAVNAYQASSAFNNHEYNKAQHNLEQALIDYPHDAQLNYNLGCVYHEQHKEQEAYDCFKRAALTDCPIQEEARFNLANTCVALGQLEEAITTYEQLLARNKNHEQAQHNLEVVKRMLEERKKNKQQEQKKDKNKQQQDKSQKDQSKDQQSNNDQQNSQNDDQQKQQQEGSNKDNNKNQEQQNDGKQSSDQQSNDKKEQQQKSDDKNESSDQKQDQQKQNEKSSENGNQKPQQEEQQKSRAVQDHMGQDDKDKNNKQQDKKAGADKERKSGLQQAQVSDTYDKNAGDKKLDKQLQAVLAQAEHNDEQHYKDMIKAHVKREMAGQFGQKNW